MITIFIDMDGVLADFNGYCQSKYGKNYSDIIDIQGFWHDKNQHKDLFINLIPLPSAYKMLNDLYNLALLYPIQFKVLTALPHGGGYPEAELHKNQWIDKYFPELSGKVLTGPYAVDKQNHCNKHDVLIDDNSRNVVQWSHKGGLGILHTESNYIASVKAVKEHLRQLGHNVP